MKKLSVLFSLLCVCLMISAQRMTDMLDRGLVALPSGSGNFISWRIMGEEYYDVEYNIYRDGVKLNSAPLKVSNFTDARGTATSKYQVAAVVRGVEQEKCAEVTRWNNGYLDIPMQPVINRDGKNTTSNYTLNDVSLADVDGDGISEFIVKRNSNTARDYSTNKTDFHRLECYNIKGKRLWYIDLGPNMISGPDEQYDIVGYDWDCDGKAEVLLRGADNMIIHKADGTTVEIGNMKFDSRNTLQSDANMAYTHTGNEFLLYLNGETAEPYVNMAYPLPRLEKGESDLNAAWGDGYGHRSTKHFFGAPVLDGRKASIFLARGAYTRHRMVAFDVDPVTHQLIERWRWNDAGGQWWGQGYHNYGIADVDMDGRDEIVFGSMVIDDNGKGLSTTGLGHGDAQHTGDFDPYRWGLEHFACNESAPSNNYRNATTSKIYYRLVGTSDDGRALCGNFTNSYPGSIAKSNGSGVISTVADKVLPNVPGFDLNFRIYWDGDLCEEILNSPGTEREAKIDKIVGNSVNRIFTSNGCKMNNWSKNNPGATGDIIGDWREEMVLRTGDDSKLRIYTTTTPTSHRIYTLWHDHQYRQAMVWQSIGYNQPPHLSYFLGELEGITVAPPPLTMTGRVEVANNETIGAELNDKHVIVCETNDMNVTIGEAVSPHVLTFNVPSWVQGATNNNKIVYDKFTYTVEGAGLVGNTRLVKQGDGILNLPKVDMTHSGNTDIWGGIVNFNGTMKNSKLWLNRFVEFNSDGGVFRKIEMDYASILRPGGVEKLGEVSTDTFNLNFGAILELDINGTEQASDVVRANYLKIETKSWEYGPQYLTPVIRLVLSNGGELSDGIYEIAEVQTIDGDLSAIKLEGTTGKKCSLKYENGKINLVVEGVRDAALVLWNGKNSSIWNYAADMNFTNAGEESYFVEDDKVSFTDDAEEFVVELVGELPSDTVFVDNTQAYTFTGSGAIVGDAALVKRGEGKLTISTDNTYTGGNRISGGSVSVSSLSNANQAFGNLGAVTNDPKKFVIENGGVLQTTASVQMGSPILVEGEEGGVINNAHDFAMDKAFSGTVLTKRGSGWLKTYASGSGLNRMIIAGGTVQNGSGNVAKVVELQGGSLVDLVGTGNEINIPEGKSGSWTTANRSTYSNKITGAGKLTVYCATEKGNGWVATRTPLQLNTSSFTGTLVPQATNGSDGRFTLNTGSGLANGIMSIPAGIVVQNTGKVYSIGELTGSGSLGGGCTFDNNSTAGNNTWKVGALNTDFTFDGTITGSGTQFEKVGTGMMTVTASSNFTGAATISEGTLCINKSSAKSGLLGTGKLTVADGATLVGVGMLNNSTVTLNKGALLRPGLKETSTSGTIKLNGNNLVVSNGATIRFYIGSRSLYTKVTDVGTMIMRGVLKVDVRDGITLTEGDEFQLWSSNTTQILTSMVLELDSIGEGLCWDTSDLESGVLRVANSNVIEPLDTEKEVMCVVYSINGVEYVRYTCKYGEAVRKLSEQGLPKGIYTVKIATAHTEVVEKYVVK
ncbi:MAG: autotransporter-associated beta strand repeat-containing protein [Bacteroidaceae bacterium]|nr:autotransporter-associated beta strand repeat-containing protein [Bacteroidaceae bacterium]